MAGGKYRVCVTLAVSGWVSVKPVADGDVTVLSPEVAGLAEGMAGLMPVDGDGALKPGGIYRSSGRF